ARREDHRVRALDVRVEGLVVLQVTQHRYRAGRLEVGGLLELADQTAGVVALLGQDLEEAERDLAVAAGDEDVHGLSSTPVAPVIPVRWMVCSFPSGSRVGGDGVGTGRGTRARGGSAAGFVGGLPRVGAG